jgi:hypothetical protein
MFYFDILKVRLSLILHQSYVIYVPPDISIWKDVESVTSQERRAAQ